MSRPRHTDRPKEKKLVLRSSLIEQTNASLVDPVSGKPGYGQWKTLIEALLEAWLEGKLPNIQPQPFRAQLDDLAATPPGD